jgi:hypothetical protein
MAADPRYFSTYYAIDGINYRPGNLSSALDTLDAAYIPLVIQEAAGVPLDPSFEEQKRIMLRCNGVFYACRKGAEARRFNRLLMDSLARRCFTIELRSLRYIFYSVYPLGSTVYVWVDRFISFSIILEFSFFYYLSMNILMGMEFHNTEREELAIRNANCVLIRLTILIF